MALRGFMYTTLCCILIGLSACSAKKSNLRTQAPWVLANWRGCAYQYNTDEHWELFLEVDSIQNSFKISYPGLECSGTWKLIYTGKDRIVLRERITRGLQNCVTRGKVVLEKREGSVVFKYFYPTDATLNAEGRLFKENRAVKN